MEHMEHMEHMEQMVIMVARDVRGGEMWGAYRLEDAEALLEMMSEAVKCGVRAGAPTGDWRCGQLSEGRNERREEASRGARGRAQMRKSAYRRAEARRRRTEAHETCRMKIGPKLTFRTDLWFALGGGARYGILPACVHGSSKARW